MRWIAEPEALVTGLTSAFTGHLRERVLDRFRELNEDPETFILDEDFTLADAARALEAAFRELLDRPATVDEADLDPEILLDLHDF